MAEEKASAGRRPGWRAAALIGLSILGLVVLALELGLRVFAPARVEAYRPQMEKLMAEARTTGHPYLAYVGKPNFRSKPGAKAQMSHDAWGLRANTHLPPKPEGVYRIVCLGGSSTYGHTPSSDATTWPARLEFWLNDLNEVGARVEVINGGMSGWSTFESTVNLAFRMLEWEPDLVIVYHSINDMRCALYDRAGPPRMDNSHWRSIWPVVMSSPGETVLEQSMTYLVLRKLFTSYVEGVDALGTYGIVNFDPADPDPYLRGDIPEQGFKNFERNLRSIQAIAKEFGAKVILASQACDERDIMAGSREAQLAGLARMATITERVAGERGLIFVDARRELEAAAAEAEGGIDAIFTGEVHLTDKGAERLALIFAKAILFGGHGLLEQK
jgi:GDSL-like lipase/acylhydrolase family protein